MYQHKVATPRLRCTPVPSLQELPTWSWGISGTCCKHPRDVVFMSYSTSSEDAAHACKCYKQQTSRLRQVRYLHMHTRHRMLQDRCGRCQRRTNTSMSSDPTSRICSRKPAHPPWCSSHQGSLSAPTLSRKFVSQLAEAFQKAARVCKSSQCSRRDLCSTKMSIERDRAGCGEVHKHFSTGWFLGKHRTVP